LLPGGQNAPSRSIYDYSYIYQTALHPSNINNDCQSFQKRLIFGEKQAEIVMRDSILIYRDK